MRMVITDLFMLVLGLFLLFNVVVFYPGPEDIKDPVSRILMKDRLILPAIFGLFLVVVSILDLVGVPVRQWFGGWQASTG